MRKLIAIVMVLLHSAILYGCSESAQDVSGAKPLIGFSMATFKEDRWLQDRDILTAKAKQEGFDILVSNANNDPDAQYTQVLDMIQRGIDVLILVPQDYSLAASCVEAAHKKGIPVLSYDRLVRSANVDAYISFDNVKVGELQARALLQAVPRGGYLIINGSQNDYNSKMFNEGYMNVLQPYIDKGKITIADEIWVEDWRKETAFAFTAENLKEDADGIQAALANNDSLAGAAIEAISEATLTGKVQVAGVDADLTACQRIVEGTQFFTTYKPIKALADETVNACKALLNQEPLSYTKTINDGTYDVPYIMIDVIPVTKDNMGDTVIKDGFQLKEDVYRTSETDNPT